MSKLFKFFASTVAVAAILGCVSTYADDEPPLETVPYVDLEQYLGKWYEIASFPQKFSEGCVASTATYALRKNKKKIDVLNECRIDTFDGELSTAHGYAKVVDKKTNAKLKVTFFWPFFGKYWIIDLGENYEYSVVGHPNREYLWILSRTPKMDQSLFQELVRRAEDKGFDIGKLNITPQP